MILRPFHDKLATNMKENKKSIKDSLWPIKRVRDSFQEDDQKVNKYYLNRMYQLKYYYENLHLSDVL